jgi:NADP-dependent 3-hydroxy acid dehydrogenase YdfG
MIQMDVNDDSSVEAGVNLLMSKQSRLDVVVNSAGNGLAGSVEDASSDEAKWQFETRLC